MYRKRVDTILGRKSLLKKFIKKRTCRVCFGVHYNAMNVFFEIQRNFRCIRMRKMFTCISTNG
ncbi:hypothetical protein HMPREF3033_00414 [Veillonellaceae bacterium DNF00751]|nr:hypothetical protein HMPREF3033_00414 [Veillonellaceae bacterium DNF00751]